MFPSDTKILVVDDVQAMREFLKGLLMEMGFGRIVEADGGEPAYRILETSHSEGDPVQLVLADWQMDGMDGFELLKKVRSAPQFKTVPFLLISAEGDAPRVMEALMAGANNYLSKPVSLNELKSKLATVWARAGKAKV